MPSNPPSMAVLDDAPLAPVIPLVKSLDVPAAPRPRPGSAVRGLLVAAPFSLALWGVIIWGVLGFPLP